MSEHMQFQAEVSRLLDIVANALYTEREIFLRELISNASDACDRRRYMALSQQDLGVPGDQAYKIRISIDTDARTVTVADNGIGMTQDELIKNLGTIAHSGTREVLGAIGEDKKNVNLIGQFGVGFYSAFMVADEVRVTSRKAGAAEASLWVSDGKSGYQVEAVEKAEPGTEIVLHIKDDASEFLLADRLKEVVRKYSDHVVFPIEMDGQQVNAASALWARPKSEVAPEQYIEFYRSVADTLQIDTPWMTLHWRAEGAYEYSNLLFIPSMKPFDLYDPKRHHGVKLYVRRVFITQGVEGLIPPFLRFVKGVVDSEDLPLNISREMLQSNPVVAKMSTAIVRKILSELEERAKTDPAGFKNFWGLFGAVVKEGLYDAHAYRDQLCRVARFYSNKAEGLVSLDEYISRMKEGQDCIYYISGPSVMACKNSPQMEALRKKGLEVLFMIDTVDEFWLPIQIEYAGKKFKSVTRGNIDLSAIKAKDEIEEDTQDQPQDEDQALQLAARFKDILAAEVKDVTLSKRLVESPVCLVAQDNDVDMHMQRVLKKNQGYEAMTQHILEINPKHPLIRKLAGVAANEDSAEKLKDAAFLLLDQARIIEGEPLGNPADFMRRMSNALEKSF